MTQNVKSRILLINILLIFFLVGIWGQNNLKITMPEIISRTPNAAMLERFGEYPIGYYTGTVPIDVNLYSLALSKNFNLNIQLSYHSGGIKVDDLNGWVGTGWSLLAGGCITRDVRGIPDDYTGKGFYSNNKNVTPSDISFMSWKEIHSLQPYEDSAPTDLEPDLFRLNLNGRSISFFLDKNRNFKTIPHSDIKINRHPLNSYNYPEVSDSNIWEIIDETGTKFIFKEKEGQIGEVGKLTTTTAWMLEQILSPEGQILASFSYKIYSIKNAKTKSRKEIFTLLMDQYGIVDVLDGLKKQVLGHKVINTPDERMFRCQLLQSITLFNGYSLKLKEGDAISDGTGFTVLKSISLNNKKDETISTYEFNYIGKSERDYLDNIVKTSGRETVRQRQFLYNGYLPLRNSTSVDYWGYYNGAGNTNLLVFNKDIYNIQSYEYANRNPSEKSTTGLIKEVHYPTGGYTEFNFEANQAYFPPTSSEENEICSKSLYSPDNFIANSQNDNYPAQIVVEKIHNKSFGSSDSKQKISFSVERLVNRSLVIDVKIKQVRTGNIVFRINGKDLYDGKYDRFITSNNDGNTRFYITEDINLKTDEDYELIMTVTKYNNLTPFIMSVFTCSHNCKRTINNPGGYKLSGGTRICNIKNIGADKQLLNYTTFSYSNPHLAIQPSFVRDYSLRSCDSKDGTSVGGITSYIKVRELGSTDLNRYSGSFSQYSNVIENKIDVNKKDTLNSEYHYSNFSFERFPADGATTGYEMPMLPFSINDYMGGLLEKKTDYITHNKKKVSIQEESFIYTKVGAPSIVEAIMINPKYNRSLCLGDPLNIKEEYTWGHYLFSSEKQVIKQSTKNVFFYNSDYSKLLSTVATIKDYEYKDNGYIQPTNSITYNSKGDKSEISNVYCYDSDLPVYKEMTKQNLINQPILQKNRVNGKQIEIFEYNWNFFNSNKIIEMEKSVRKASDNSKITEVKYLNYDSYGNSVYITKDDATSFAYLWSYSGQYPIAEIQNATFAEAESAAKSVFSVASVNALSALSTPNETKLKDGSLQKALPNALVTTYTYKPLVGILTATDPSGITTYYDYDSFGRLKETYIYKDNIVTPANKQIIQKYDYHYRNQ